MPRLHAAALARQHGGRGRRLAGMLVRIAGYALLLVVPSAYGQAHAGSALEAGAWLDHHALLIAALGAMAAALRVSRRRALNAGESLRCWTAALPMTPAAARLQGLLIETAPAARLAAFGAAALGGWAIATRVLSAARPELSETASPLAALLVGITAGTGLSYLRSPSRPGETHEGSRYVPHRRRREPPVPRGSLAALGIWPVRAAFASARPQTVARLLVPVLVFMPLGTSADRAMLAIGLALAAGAVGSLGAALLRVQAAARRWLRPLPLAQGVLIGRLLPQLLAAMAGAAALAVGFLVLLRTWVPPR
jgi:hypothetical protein